MTADTNSPLLGLLLMGTGNDNNSWGDNHNSNVTLLLEQAVADAVSIATTGGTLTLSATQARYNTIRLTGTLASDLVVVVPDTNKTYRFRNSTTGNGFFTRLKCATGSAEVNLPHAGKTTAVTAIGGVPYRDDSSEVGRYVYDAASAPGDVLECNGASMLRASLPELFAKIGTNYGSVDALHFNLPDAYTTGRFLRSRNASVAVGTQQANQNKSHTHTGSGTTSSMSGNTTHTHTGSGTTSGISVGHTHTFTSGGMNSNNLHSHTGSGTTSGVSAFHTHSVSGTSASGGVDHSHTGSGTTSGVSADHSHSGTTSGASVSMSHSHTVSGTTATESVNHTHTTPEFITSVNNGGGANQGNLVNTVGGSAANLVSGVESATHTHTWSGTSSTVDLAHTHTITTGGASVDHSHTYSFTTSGASAYLHTHTFSATTGGDSVDHSHTYSFTTSTVDINHTHSGTTDGQSVDHTHTYSFTTSANTTIDHTHTYSFTTSTGSADGTEARPETLVGVLCIRY